MRLHNWAAPGLTLRSRVAMGLMSATWRPMSHAVPDSPRSTRAARALIARAMTIASPPLAGATFDRVEEGTGPIVRGEWVRTPATTREDAVVLYLHGSGYVVCSSRTHRGLTSQIAERTRVPVFSIDYRLAPTHSYPAAPQDVRAAWDWLVAGGYAPERIVVAGDSAGGHLALTLALELARSGQALPAALVTLSPVIDLSLRHGIPRDRIEHDPFAAAWVARRALQRYADATALADDGLRIEFEDLDRFPPTLVHAGSREMLAADCTELVRRMTAAGLDVSYRVWPGLMHVFQAMTAVMSESDAALAEVAAFIVGHVPAADSSQDLTAAASA